MKWSLGKRVAAMVVAVGLLAGAQVGAAGAWESAGMRTQSPSAGGTWEYGYHNLYLRSYYGQHVPRQHRVQEDPRSLREGCTEHRHTRR